MKKHWTILVFITLLFVVVISLAFADGNEELQRKIRDESLNF